MAHEITLEQAVENAEQAEIVCRLLESHPHSLQDCEVSAVASLLSTLTSRVAAWLMEEQAQRMDAEAAKRKKQEVAA